MIPARVHDAAPEPGRDALDAETVAGRADVTTEATQLLDDPFDPIRLLRPQLGRAANDGLTASVKTAAIRMV